MQKHILVIILSISCLSVFSQKRQNVYYIKNGIPIKDKELADYRRVIQEPDSGSTLYNLLEFYPDNTEKTIARVSKYEPNLVYDGIMQSFNKKGILVEKTNYVNGKMSGEASYFYENGKLKKTLIYDANVKAPGVNTPSSYKIISYFDSSGNQSIKEGNGYLKEKNSTGFDEGTYLNSNKDGIWKGEVLDGTYEEKYDNGKFISGEAKSANGKKSKYKIPDEYPDFPGGIGEFYKYIGKEFKYPKEAIAMKVSGKLYINFVVDKDGSLTDITFKNRMGYGIEDAALKIFEDAPKWNPGKSHGIPLRVKYNININLKPM